VARATPLHVQKYHSTISLESSSCPLGGVMRVGYGGLICF